MFVATDVAQWMLKEVTERRYLDQYTAVSTIGRKFGEDFVYQNENGNPAILPKVLKEFRRLSKETVVWERSERAWRLRTPHDTPGRRQSDY